jgi:hypothetical protein
MARRLELDELVEYGWDITVTATSGPFCWGAGPVLAGYNQACS